MFILLTMLVIFLTLTTIMFMCFASEWKHKANELARQVMDKNRAIGFMNDERNKVANELVEAHKKILEYCDTINTQAEWIVARDEKIRKAIEVLQ